MLEQVDAGIALSTVSEREGGMGGRGNRTVFFYLDASIALSSWSGWSGGVVLDASIALDWWGRLSVGAVLQVRQSIET
jgi:hypothetical protein